MISFSSPVSIMRQHSVSLFQLDLLPRATKTPQYMHFDTNILYIYIHTKATYEIEHKLTTAVYFSGGRYSYVRTYTAQFRSPHHTKNQNFETGGGKKRKLCNSVQHCVLQYIRTYIVVVAIAITTTHHITTIITNNNPPG